MGFTTYTLFSILLAVLFVVLYAAYHLFVGPYFSPLRDLPGPPVSGKLGSHLPLLLDANRSAIESEKMVKLYGRNFCIQGMGAHDQRLMTFDPVAVSHILNRSTVYEKPWQSRRLITRLIGEGMLASEGNVHKRQRKVSNPVFSYQNLRALMPIFFEKAEELRDRWAKLTSDPTQCTRIDVSHWLGRATFDIIGLAGFDYPFRAIQDESNEVYLAYRDMFEIAISRGQDLKSVFGIYFPLIHILWPDEKTRVIAKSKKTIYTVGRELVHEKKRNLLLETETGRQSQDLLSLLLKSNMSTEIPEEQRISDDDILNQISTFLFAGSDTSSLALTWTLYLLATHPEIQQKLRTELRKLSPVTLSDSWIDVEDSKGTTDSATLFSTIDNLPFLDRVLRESLRLIPPIPSTLRVATQDDEIPLSEPVTMKDGSKRSTIHIGKGQFAHVAMEGFNLDRGIWGEDGWEFNPDRWLDLPKEVATQPGLYSNLLTFSAGPRSCIGIRFAIIEMKVFLYTLISNFVFSNPAEIVKANVVLTRPYLRGRFKEGSQCPLTVRLYDGSQSNKAVVP